VPEEFRIWKERMDALGKKKVAALQPPHETQAAIQSPGAMGNYCYCLREFIMLNQYLDIFSAPHNWKS
jgi:hypothetical protein